MHVQCLSGGPGVTAAHTRSSLWAWHGMACIDMHWHAMQMGRHNETVSCYLNICIYICHICLSDVKQLWVQVPPPASSPHKMLYPQEKRYKYTNFGNAVSEALL